MNSDIINFKEPEKSLKFNLSVYTKLTDDCEKTFYFLKFSKKIYNINYQIQKDLPILEFDVKSLNEEEKSIELENGKILKYLSRNSFFNTNGGPLEMYFSNKSFAKDKRNVYIQNKINDYLKAIEQLQKLKNFYENKK